MGPASGPPLLTIAEPSNTQGSTTVPHVGVEPEGIRAPMLKTAWVVPFGFGVVSSGSSAARPAVAMSAATVVVVGKIVAVWKPWSAKETEVPVATVVVCGK